MKYVWSKQVLIHNSLRLEDTNISTLWYVITNLSEEEQPHGLYLFVKVFPWVCNVCSNCFPPKGGENREQKGQLPSTVLVFLFIYAPLHPCSLRFLVLGGLLRLSRYLRYLGVVWEASRLVSSLFLTHLVDCGGGFLLLLLLVIMVEVGLWLMVEVHGGVFVSHMHMDESFMYRYIIDQ